MPLCSRDQVLYGCSVHWESLKRGKHSAPAEDGSVSASPTPPGSPENQASQHAGALSSGEAEGTHTDEDEDDTYCESDDSGGDRAVHFSEQFDPEKFGENPLEIDWSGFKYPVPNFRCS